MSRRRNEQVIRRYVEGLMPPRTRKLATAARWDLHQGPHAHSRAWPGYTSACEAIQDWIDDEMPSELWLDTQSDDVLTSEPDGFTDEDTGEYVEPVWEDFVHYDARAIKRVMFGELIGNGID